MHTEMFQVYFECKNNFFYYLFFSCGQSGHISRDCDQQRGGGRKGGGRGTKCYECQELGHIARLCPNRE